MWYAQAKTTAWEIAREILGENATEEQVQRCEYWLCKHFAGRVVIVKEAWEKIEKELEKQNNFQ